MNPKVLSIFFIVICLYSANVTDVQPQQTEIFQEKLKEDLMNPITLPQEMDNKLALLLDSAKNDSNALDFFFKQALTGNLLKMIEDTTRNIQKEVKEHKIEDEFAPVTISSDSTTGSQERMEQAKQDIDALFSRKNAKIPEMAVDDFQQLQPIIQNPKINMNQKNQMKQINHLNRMKDMNVKGGFGEGDSLDDEFSQVTTDIVEATELPRIEAPLVQLKAHN